MKQIYRYRIIVIILVSVLLSETLWIINNLKENHSGQEETWDFSYDYEITSHFEEALTDGRIEVWFQPIVDPNTNETVGAEALSRWKDKDGYISPSVFVPALEESGQVLELDKNAFLQACRFQKERKDAGENVFPISVNLSVVSLAQDNIVSDCLEILNSNGVPAESISIEVTESIDSDKGNLGKVVNDLHTAGFLVEIDDFGAGYASLVNLALIPYDVLKIDKSIIDEIGTERGDLLLCDTINMAKDFNFKVIVEGVETEDQIEYLKSKGCDAVQGYYYSKPLSYADFINYLNSNS